MSKFDWEEIEVTYLHHTDSAVLVNITGNLQGGVWLPRSQVKWEVEEYPRGTTITIMAPEWLLEKEGLI
jgi:hypothetical protein